jgi:hypothetical protein
MRRRQFIAGLGGVAAGGAVRLEPLACAFGSIALLAGCLPGTGILPAGPNTYRITEKNLGGVFTDTEPAERAALTQANEYCAQQGRQFVPLIMKGTPGAPARFPTYTVTFKCLLQGDPEIAKFKLQPTPNVVIKQRNR